MSTISEVRKACLDDLFTFVSVIYPNRYLGDLHRDMFKRFSNEDIHDLLELTPRDHQKSFCIAMWCAWHITKHPDTTIAYISANKRLATMQCQVVKDVLENKAYRELFPNILNWEKEKNTWKHKPLYKWNEEEFSVYHPLRKERGIRESTFYATSVGSTNTGFHFQVLVLDDLVTEMNYISKIQRDEVKRTFSTFSALSSAETLTRIVGTTYSSKDLYNEVIIPMEEEIFDRKGEFIGTRTVFDTKIRKVEDNGVFLWPRKQLDDGRWFGFDWQEISRKKAKYKASGEYMQFLCQYYNAPNDPALQRINISAFKYFEEKDVMFFNGSVSIRGNRLNVYAAMDIAFTENKNSDYTAIVVVGQDGYGQYYVLDLQRFKTNKYNIFYERILAAHNKWNFIRLQIETNAGGSLVCQYIKEQVMKEGRFLRIKAKRRNASEGSKVERMAMILDPLYENEMILHCKIGLISTLEDELVSANPAHDDLKDTLSSCIEICTKPNVKSSNSVVKLKSRSRFGGI